MKISRLQRDITLNQGSSRLHSEPQNFREKNVGAYNDSNRGYSAGFNGSFTGKSETAVNAMKKGGVLTSNWFNKFLTYSNDHNVATSALVALGLAGVLRPATIMALPGKKDKEDKIYASGHSMASAILGFVASVIVTSPLDGAVKKIFGSDGYLKDKDGNIIKDSQGKPKIFSKKLVELMEKEKSLEKAAKDRDKVTGVIKDKAAKEAYKAVKRHRAALETLSKNIPDWVIAVPRSILTIALIPPILKYVFGVEKKKKPAQAEPQKAIDNNMQTQKTMDFVNKPVFQQIKQGSAKADNNAKQQSFTGNVASEAAQAVVNTSKDKSSIFKPLSDFYDRCTDSVAKYFTSKVVDSKPMNYIADKLKDSNNLFQHCLTTGSLITSGLYMEKTLTNDKLDKDRKKTLAVNQGLTFIISTAGAYSLDKYLKKWWENVTAKFVGYQIDDEKFHTNFKKINEGIEEINRKLKQDPKADVNKIAEEVKKSMNMPKAGEKGYKGYTEYLEHAVKGAIEDADDAVKSVEKLGLNKYIDKLVESKSIPELSKELSGKIKGMGALRTMLVFGFVYRFFVPVVVTKPANWLCEKYLSSKKAKAEQKAETQKA